MQLQPFLMYDQFGQYIGTSSEPVLNSTRIQLPHSEKLADGNTWVFTGNSWVEAVTMNEQQIPQFDASAPFELPAPATSIILSSSEFFAFFTQDELVKFYTLAKTEVPVEVLLDTVKMTGKVDVLAEEITLTIELLVAGEVLTQERADELMRK